MADTKHITILGRYNQIKSEYEASDKSGDSLKELYSKLNEFSKDELVEIAANIKRI